MATIVGIDGCSTGWLCVIENLGTGVIESRILARIDELLLLRPVPAVVAVDIPIGLPDVGRRECDREARTILGKKRRSSVFSAPIRSMLDATDYVDACAIGRSKDGRALSKQAWGIVPKIREIDRLLRSSRKLRRVVYEVHPEVSFCLWNNGVPMQFRKKDKDGRTERESLVLPAYKVAYKEAQLLLKRGAYANDDLLDAFAALWSASRIHHGRSIRLPEKPPKDSCGLKMQIVA